ncbi:HlyD family type I secretion periplasmic adaptor subunit [Nitrogeniibacter mangrovi]|uniref:Membrane fusion protein (MFP) family protein n=1 Tax=Nitrogeniibacter mangrovi TaxID=2016596 RepID=A0A6C1B3B0_9RHOO|nr:HlyD family type I secretion periplasmic adaptor subunit [Nitrogeniibacter mangrovi]QID18142.1 HlyD family type I secretion periplasmic adaptor subunit [Nitrogeniibacter mangrovi]
MIAQAALDLLGRYRRVFAAAWKVRKDMTPHPRGALEREFLPAALELQDTPPSPLPRVILWPLIAAFSLALVWSIFGRIDTVAVATGKIIPSTRAQIIQPLDTAVVRAIHVTDGQQVKAGDLLVELDATDTGAADTQAREAWIAARLRAARSQALLDALETDTTPRLPPLEGVPPDRRSAEARLLDRQHTEYLTRQRALNAEYQRARAEQRATEQLVAKLEATLPIVQQREHDYKDLMEKAFVSRHGYLEQEQARIETERDLAYQRAKATELKQAIAEAQGARDAWQAEFLRNVTSELTEAQQQAGSLAAEVEKTENRNRLMHLTAPVDGTVQQLAIHTEGGVVTEAQPLMVIVPTDYSAEVEAILENKDVGFVKSGQIAEVKIETFPFTRYGTIPAEVTFVSNDAVDNEQRGLVFPVRLKLERATLKVDERTVNLTPGMAITAEIKTGSRRAIEYFLSPVLTTIDESLGER